jgi:signal peptidase I
MNQEYNNQPAHTPDEPVNEALDPIVQTDAPAAPKASAEPVSRMSTKKKNKKKETIGWIISLSTAVVLALLLRFFVFEFVLVDGPSMEPTLWTKEIMLVEKVTYKFSPPERYNVVVVTLETEKTTVVKRVIGLPGDTLQIKDGKLYINDKLTEESYLGEAMDPAQCDFEPVTVPDNCIFVMGDHRNVSVDSRAVGPIPYQEILGRAVFVVWPFDKITPLSGK